MKILVDADACPVKDIIIQLAKEYQLPVYLFFDTSHIWQDDYCKVITVDKANDSVDFALANQTKNGDIAITQDYGLATMLLAKGATVVHQNGFVYTDNNIEQMLFERHLSKELRRQKKHHHCHNKKRKKEDDIAFEQCLRKVCESLCLS